MFEPGSVIRIIYGRDYIDFNVKETKPSHYITALETDIEVDFEKPLNYEEPPPPPPKKEYKPKPPKIRGLYHSVVKEIN